MSIHRRPTSLIVLTSTALIAPLAIATPSSAATNEIHVAVGGSDRNAGTATAPKASIQAAVDAATPGTVIKVHKGTYSGQIKIKNSGTKEARIHLTNANDGEVVLTSNQPAESCSNTRPSPRRTIMISGASNWIIRGLTIVNGVYIMGKKANAAYSWHANKVKANNWQDRRKVPGRATRNPASTPQVVPYLRRVTGESRMVSADRIEFYNNKIRGRGIYAALSSYGVVRDNTISDIICGSGPGLWVMTFSDRWTVTGNDISRIAPGSVHFMHEGIRFGTASNYNYIADNYVHDLNGDGRAYNTDVDSSFNLFQRNRANNVAIGYSDQMAGWGNTWQNNAVTNFRKFGYALRMLDLHFQTPSKNSSTNGVILRCNRASAPVGTAKALGVGGSMNARIAGNWFESTWVSKPARTYWGAYGNRYNGSAQPPEPKVTPTTCT